MQVTTISKKSEISISANVKHKKSKELDKQHQIPDWENVDVKYISDLLKEETLTPNISYVNIHPIHGGKNKQLQRDESDDPKKNLQV